MVMITRSHSGLVLQIDKAKMVNIKEKMVPIETMIGDPMLKTISPGSLSLDIRVTMGLIILGRIETRVTIAHHTMPMHLAIVVHLLHPPL